MKKELERILLDYDWKSMKKFQPCHPSSTIKPDSFIYNEQSNNNFMGIANQARYQAAIALSNNPGIYFSGILIEWSPSGTY